MDLDICIFLRITWPFSPTGKMMGYSTKVSCCRQSQFALWEVFGSLRLSHWLTGCLSSRYSSTGLSKVCMLTLLSARPNPCHQWHIWLLFLWMWTLCQPNRTAKLLECNLYHVWMEQILFKYSPVLLTLLY